MYGQWTLESEVYIRPQSTPQKTQIRRIVLMIIPTIVFFITPFSKNHLPRKTSFSRPTWGFR